MADDQGIKREPGARAPIRVAFSFVERDRNAYFQPEDGYGYVSATGSKLSMEFQCGGVTASADLSYEDLTRVLAGATPNSLVDLCVANLDLGSKVVSLSVELETLGETNAALMAENQRLRHAIDSLPEEAARHLVAAEETITRLEALLEEARLAWQTCREEYAELRAQKNVPVWGLDADEHRVLNAAERIPIADLRWLSESKGYNQPASDPIHAFVSFEISRRIAGADLDLPYWNSDDVVVKTPHEALFRELDEATEAGNRARAMTEEEREKRYEDFVRAKGWLQEGDSLAPRPRREAKGSSDS